MPDCKIHIPHKTDLLTEPSTVQDAFQSRRQQAERDAKLRENWSTIERFINESGCLFGGGCGMHGPEPDGNPHLTASGNYSCAGGFSSSALADEDFAYGFLNVAGGARGAVVGGSSNIIGAMASENGIIGGTGNEIDLAGTSFIGGGNTNVIDAASECALIGGLENHASGSQTGIVSGTENTVDGEYTAILGGRLNEMHGNHNVALGGFTNTVVDDISEDNAIVGGSSNTIDETSDRNVIAGSTGNQIKGNSDDNFIAGGGANLIDNGAEGCAILGDNIHMNGAISSVAFGSLHEVTGSDQVAMGDGATPWSNAQLAHSNSIFTPLPFLDPPRAVSQYSRAHTDEESVTGTYSHLYPLDSFADIPALYFIQGTVVGVGISPTDTTSYEFECAVQADGAGAWAFVDSPVSTVVVQTPATSGWDLIVALAGDQLDLQVLNGPSGNARWSAVVKVNEVLTAVEPP